MAAKPKGLWIGVTLAAVGIGGGIIYAATRGGGKEKGDCQQESPVPYEYLELNGATWGDSNPTLVVFHGLGGQPQAILDAVKTDKPVKIISPQGFNALGQNRAWWFERANSNDQKTLAAQMKWAADEIEPLLANIAKCNKGEVIVAGHSQGGMMALNLARHSPSVTGAIAASGWLPVELQGDMAPFVAIHGASDDVVPFDRTRDWVQGINSEAAEFVEVPGAHGLAGAIKETWQAYVDAALG